MKQTLKQYRQAMKCFRRLITLSVSIVLILTLTAKACDIVLKTRVNIPRDSIYLKDITLKCPRKVKNQFIADSPYINNPLIITKTYIKAILKRMHFKYTVCGSKVKVLRKKFYITKKTVFNLLGKKNITILSRMPIVLPYNNYEIKIKKVINNREFVYIELSVFKNGDFYRNIGISAKRKLSIVFPVAKYDIRRGEIITLNKIKFAKIATPLQNTALKSIQAIVGKIAITDIRQNQPFTTSNTKREELVKMGDLVKVDVIDGSIKISTIAKALRSGFKNDIIPIMYLHSKRIAVATIIGKKEVEIQ